MLLRAVTALVLCCCSLSGITETRGVGGSGVGGVAGAAGEGWMLGFKTEVCIELL